MPDGIKSLEVPGRRAFGTSSQQPRGGEHLDFTGQIVSHHGAKSEYLVASQSASGDDIEASVVLGISEDGFLRATAIVEQDHAFG